MADIRCLVVDDEPLAARLIGSYVERTPFLSLVATVNSAAEALAVMASDAVDLVFLDIRMPGMDLARQLGNGPKIVFTTAYSDHAVEGFAVNALDYLLKPVSYEEFMRAAGRALAAVSGRTEEKAEPLPSSGFITVKSEYRLVRIPVAEIDYIEGLKDYVKIVLGDGSRPVLTLMSMKNLEEMLPEASFMRVHRSFIVNMDKVRVIERNCVVMGRQLIPVSESARKRFFSALGMSQS